MYSYCALMDHYYHPLVYSNSATLSTYTKTLYKRDLAPSTFDTPNLHFGFAYGSYKILSCVPLQISNPLLMHFSAHYDWG